MLRILRKFIVTNAILVVLVGSIGCQINIQSDSVLDAMPESLQFLIADKNRKSPFRNKNLDFTCAESISYSLTTLTADMNPYAESGLRFDPMIVENGPDSEIEEIKFGRLNTILVMHSWDIAAAIVDALENHDVLPRCKASETGSDVKIKFVEVFNFDGPENLLPRHVKVLAGDEGEIQIAIVLGYRQLIRDYLTAKTGAYNGINHHFTVPSFSQWAGYYASDLTGTPIYESGRLISSEAALNSIPPDILEFLQNTPSRTTVSHLSVVNVVFGKLSVRSAPFYSELMSGLIWDCLNQSCPDDGEYGLRDRVSEESFQKFTQSLKL